MEEQNGERLINELLTDSRKFDEDGRAYDLLQMYFAGLPLDTLRPLLRSDDVFVQRAASFIASELGSRASSLVDDVAPLVSSTDGHVQWYAMEVLAVCGKGEHAEKFAHVVRMLDSDNDALRRLAMRLTANADLSQLEGARRLFETWGECRDTHEQALMALAAGSQVVPAAVSAMMKDSHALVRRYGAIAVKRLFREDPDLISQARSSDDPDLQSFFES